MNLLSACSRELSNFPHRPATTSSKGLRLIDFTFFCFCPWSQLCCCNQCKGKLNIGASAVGPYFKTFPKQVKVYFLWSTFKRLVCSSIQLHTLKLLATFELTLNYMAVFKKWTKVKRESICSAKIARKNDILVKYKNRHKKRKHNTFTERYMYE